MKNLLDCLETRSLSFNKFSVFNLIAQSLWQIGPLNTIHNFFPESHFDFSQPNYLSVLCKILDEYLDLITKKWNDYLVLYVIIVIVQRIITLMRDHDDRREEMINLLRKCRKTSKNWEKMLNNKSISRILTYVCCFSLLTYNIDGRFLENAMFDDEDLVDWLESYVTLSKQNTTSSTKSTFLTNLFNQVEICSVRVSDQYLKVIGRNNGQALTRLVGLIWPDPAAKLATFNDWTTVYGNEYPFWFTTKCKREDRETVLHVNVKGEFLVNGFPNGTLPSAILNHPGYKRFFGSLDFEVHPASNGIGSFVSAIKNEDASLTFFLSNDSSLVVQEERIGKIEINNGEKNRKTNSISRLIPHRLFEKHFPEMFSQNFSHWLNTQTNCIEFRPNNYKNYQNNIKKAAKFCLDLNTLILTDLSNNRCLIDIKSETFREITNKITNRLDQTKNVHLFTNKDSKNEFYIYLPRLNLKFTVIVNSCVLSDDFKGK